MSTAGGVVLLGEKGLTHTKEKKKRGNKKIGMGTFGGGEWGLIHWIVQRKNVGA